MEYSKFDLNDLSRPIYNNGVYDNPWSTWRMPSLSDLFRWKFFYKDNKKIPSDSYLIDQNLPVHQITDDEIKNFCVGDTTKKLKVIWIGHATSLINFQNTIVLMDPLFTERDSPFKLSGRKRYRPVPIKIEKIPRIDAVIISHNHYDHLDYRSILALHNKFGDSLNWFVGRGTGEWFKSCGITKNVHELTWWESKVLNNLEFIFTPAQHWSSRAINDRNKALWGGWIIQGNNSKVYFAGDTGYCPAFREIGEIYGPFDYSFIPIGAYEPRWMMGAQHVDPEEAIKIHLDVKSKKSIGIHWGTLAMASEFYMEPKEKLKEILKNLELNQNDFITLKHGEIYEF